jgi:hypothetical protein
MVTAQASDQELEQALAQAMVMAPVLAMVQLHGNLNRRTQLPKIEWKQSRTR